MKSRAAAAALLCLALTAGCANDKADTSAPTTDDTGSAAASTTSTTAPPAACDQEPTQSPVTAAAVDGVPSDRDVTSFDGTNIRAHWFPAPGDDPHPTVLMGPGWSQPGSTLAQDPILFGALGIKGMNDAGYNVLTWDPRGFGESTGLASVNDPLHEGRDVQVLLDWIAEQPQSQLDRDGDPRVGMVGASYGGGIQLTVAAIDCRVDALVPSLAWHSLGTSLNKSQTVKAGWAGFLNTAALTFGGRLDPHITSSAESGIGRGVLSDEDRQWFLDRGPGDDIDRVTAPTLFVQGTVDTLFTLDEAVTNYESLRHRGVPTAMIWFCGGHGTCLTDEGDAKFVNERSFAWLARYLKGDESVDTGVGLDVVDQHAAHWTSDHYPVELTDPVTAGGSGTLALALDASSAAGPLAKAREGANDVLSSSVLNITPSKASKALEVKVDPGVTDALSIGAPELRVRYTGTTPSGDRPTRVFAQLVDDDTGIVLGNQITPIDVTLDGKEHETTVNLEMISFRLQPGHTLTLQLVANTVAYAQPRLGGSVEFAAIDLSLPVAKDMTPG
jgi:ABC-2 type transport system ATP-binding protein